MAKKSFFERLTGATQEEILQEKPRDEISLPKKIELEEPGKTPLKTKTKKATPASLREEVAGGSGKEWSPDEEGELTIDVYQTDSHVVIKSTIAGVKSEDLDVNVTDGMITIKGTRQRDESVSQEKYYCRELYWGPFSRSVILPVDVAADKTKASIRDGVLTIKLPKAEKLKTKTIKVKELE